MQCANVLGIPIAVVTQETAIAALHQLLTGDRLAHVMTVNNEMLVEAKHNPAFACVLRAADLALPDSTGVAWAMRLAGVPRAVRVPGVDVFAAVCRSLTPDQSVFFLGAAPGVAERAARAMQALHPGLRIAGTYAGSPAQSDADAIIERIRKAEPTMLLVAYGAPAQDLWIAQYGDRLPSVRVAAGVGGTFDFWAGERRRAPRFLRRLGMEWLWRLLCEPRRFLRIVRATVVFPWLVLRGAVVP